jgi:hypothetical protein
MVMGYKPVYSTDSSQFRVEALGPQPVKFAGKIYVKGNLIFQNDLGSGIHVIDNSNPNSPNRVGFIRVVGNSEISIKGNYLYANSFTDLLVIDISNWQNVVEVTRVRQAFFAGSQAYAGTNITNNYIPLPERGVYFECPGNTNIYSVQTGWVKDSVSTYSCYNP